MAALQVQQWNIGGVAVDVGGEGKIVGEYLCTHQSGTKTTGDTQKNFWVFKTSEV